MQPITSAVQSLPTLRVREAMAQLRAERAETVQRMMKQVAMRQAAGQNKPAGDPTGTRGTKVDIAA